MSQKVLASHRSDARGSSDLVEVKVDQVVLAREPNRVLGVAVEDGLTATQPEVCVAYPPWCMPTDAEDGAVREAHRVPAEALQLGFLVAQPGAGFAAVTHLERFGSPSRLTLSDEPRMAACGAAGMLALPASRSQLSEALRTGHTQIRPPRSLYVNLTGRLRPFVSVRDVALDLQRRGLHELIRETDATHHAPVVLEFGGSSAKFLSVAERAVLCGLAPLLGAAGALFGSDERTEFFLRDQRRSKAHRALHADGGAPYDATLSLDLASVEPLAQAESGRIVALRELNGRPVSQVLLGGDTGITLRDLLAVAALLKSKRVPPCVEFLLCPPSRQSLEVLARGGALVDLLAARARLVEPDRRVLSGRWYGQPLAGGEVDAVRLRNADREVDADGGAGAPVIVASAESLAFAVAHGHLGDPRQFRRPVRVSIPRTLPTDDALLVRGKDARGQARGKGRKDRRAEDSSPVSSDSFAPPPAGPPSSEGLELQLTRGPEAGNQPYAYIATDLEDLRRVLQRQEGTPQLRAVVATHIPAALVSLLSGVGVFAFRAEETTLRRLGRARVLTLPSPESWEEDGIVAGLDDEEVEVEWLARGVEREWAR